MTFSQNIPPITKENMVIKNHDSYMDLSFVFGPTSVNRSIDEHWESLMNSRIFRLPPWAPDRRQMLDTVRAIVENYKLYDLLYRQSLTLLLIVRDEDTWGLHSRVPDYLPGLGPQGFRLRIDHFLSANIGRKDLGWGMVLKDLRENHPWEGVIHEDLVPYLVEQVRKHFDANNLFKCLRTTNKAIFLAVKHIPHRQMQQYDGSQNNRVRVYTPEPYWQIEFIDKELLIDNPLDRFHQTAVTEENQHER